MTTTKQPRPRVKTAPRTDPASQGHPGAKEGQVRRTSVELDGGGPRIIVDTREKIPLPCHEFMATETRGLTFGDYSVTSDGPEGVGLTFTYAIELKRTQDLVHCLTTDRDRFEVQLAKMRGVHYARLLILGHPSAIETGRYRGGISPKAILGSLSALEARHGIATVWITEPRDAAQWICRTAYYHWRERAKMVRKVKPTDLAYVATASTLQHSVALAN